MNRQHAIVVSGGAAACTACCAPAIGAGLAAIGIGSLVAAVWWGLIGLVVGAIGAVVVVTRRRRWNWHVRSRRAD